MSSDRIKALIPPHVSDVVADGCVLTIGNFDGVHLGHRAILNDVCNAGEALGLPAVAMTFEPHPVAFFRGMDASDFRVMSTAQREQRLRDVGVDLVWTVPFDRDFANIEAIEFSRDLVVRGLRARHVHVGYDFNFGKGRRGDAALMQRVATEEGIEMTFHRAIERAGRPISSTWVREAVRSGDARLVRDLLGGAWIYDGVPAKGHGRGRGMGIPTINLYPDAQLLPKFGVYATALTDNDRTWAAITNLGVRPTFNDDPRASIETLVLDDAFEEASGGPVRVEIIARVRDEQKFDSKDALVAQINQEVDVAKAAHQVWLTERSQG